MSRPVEHADVATTNHEKWVLPITRIRDGEITAGNYPIVFNGKGWQLRQYPHPHTVIFGHRLHVATLNLGFFVMANKRYGTEAKQVELCQQRYNGGWHDNPKVDRDWHHRILSQCTYNAAKFLSRYDLFGLQEVNPSYRLSLERAIDNGFQFVSGKRILTGYNPSITGYAVPLTPPDFMFPCHPAKDRRAMQVIWFPKLDLLFVNLHAPHNIDLKTEIEACLGSMSERSKRVIMVGDFNDHDGTLLHQTIDVFGKRLRIPGGKRIDTCCTDNGYKLPGDYIFTDIKDYEYYGRPPNYVRGHPLMSDHDPVVLLSYI